MLAGNAPEPKFVVCGFNGKKPVVYCGSSNLALGGEQSNGDKLLAIHDEDIATAFTIEALALVDHVDFLDRYADHLRSKRTTSGKVEKRPARLKTASKQKAAALVEWHLGTSDKWVQPYYDRKDLHCMDRELFG